MWKKQILTLEEPETIQFCMKKDLNNYKNIFLVQSTHQLLIIYCVWIYTVYLTELLLQPPTDECVWWCNTSEDDGTLKCHWTFQSALLQATLPKHNLLLIPFREHDAKQHSAKPESYQCLPDYDFWTEREHIMFKWWVYHSDTIVNQWCQPNLSALDWLPVLQQFTHSMKHHSFQRLLSPSRVRWISSQTISEEIRFIQRIWQKGSPGVEGQQQSHCAD